MAHPSADHKLCQGPGQLSQLEKYHPLGQPPTCYADILGAPQRGKPVNRAAQPCERGAAVAGKHGGAPVAQSCRALNQISARPRSIERI
jgi:hypothetical protein